MLLNYFKALRAKEGERGAGILMDSKKHALELIWWLLRSNRRKGARG